MQNQSQTHSHPPCSQHIDGLFARLAAIYGRSFAGQFDGIEPAAVKAAWAHELAGFANKPWAYAYAFDHLPERPPNVLEFRNLCRAAPAPIGRVLNTPAANPDRIAQARALLGRLQHSPTGSAPSTDWARRILARRDLGEHINPAALRFAREALGIGKEGQERVSDGAWKAAPDDAAWMGSGPVGPRWPESIDKDGSPVPSEQIAAAAAQADAEFEAMAASGYFAEGDGLLEAA